MFYSVWEFVINLLETVLFATVANGKCQKRRFNYHHIKQLVYIFSKSVFITILNLMNASTLITMISVLFLNFLFLILFFNSAIFTDFFLSLVYSILLIISDALTIFIPSKLFNINISRVLYTGNLRVPFSLIYISIIALFVIFFLLFVENVFLSDAFEKISFFIISTTCVILEEIVMIVLLELPLALSHYYNLLLCIFGLTLFLFIFLTIYFYRLGKEKEKNIQLIQKITITDMENRQNKEIIKSVQNLRILKHDIKNHLSVLHDLLISNKFEEAIKYIKEINHTIEKTTYIISTGILSIDCIMTSKLSTAMSNNIIVTHQIHFPSEFHFSDMDMCSLFGNLLDNAIESNCKLANDNRKISIEIKPYNQMLSICIMNNSDGIYNFDSHDNLTTTKENSLSLHGMGISRIKDIVEKYDGIIEITPESEKFTVSILLPLN